MILGMTDALPEWHFSCSHNLDSIHSFSNIWTIEFHEGVGILHGNVPHEPFVITYPVAVGCFHYFPPLTQESALGVQPKVLT